MRVITYFLMAGIIASLAGGCAPVNKPDEKTWQNGWQSGSYYAPPQTDL